MREINSTHITKILSELNFKTDMQPESEFKRGYKSALKDIEKSLI